MKRVVISLGGSLIVPKKEDRKDYLEAFKKIISANTRTHSFVIVCGGGAIARRYIDELRKEGKSLKQLSLAGIRATRMNASFVMQMFGKKANDSLPGSMKEVKDNLEKNKIVICGALRYTPRSTSDGTAARLAHYLKAEFINITNVPGLYTANPLTHPKAKFIAKDTWKEFEKRAKKLKFHAGQHFVLDQEAATLIRVYKIPTYIIGENPKSLDNLLSGKPFKGTTIKD